MSFCYSKFQVFEKLKVMNSFIYLIQYAIFLAGLLPLINFAESVFFTKHRAICSIAIMQLCLTVKCVLCFGYFDSLLWWLSISSSIMGLGS